MRVEFNIAGDDLAPSLRTLIEQHFRFAASPFRSSLRSIRVKLSDVGRAGAVAAKRCEAELHLRNGGAMKIQRQDARAEYAVQRVAEQIFRLLHSRRWRRRARPGVSTAA